LVEDNANESSLLASYLEQRGIEVITAADGADALDLLSARPKPPDVVLLDMMMPRCDGPTTVRAIRCNPEFQGMRIYAVSGSSPNSHGVPTGPAGVDAWFQKPLNPERLVQEMVALR
jgi:DNA-binding response OmpR family regulator